MRVRTAIETKLREALAPEAIEIVDESHKHKGHAGARPEGESHFHVRIVSPAFAGKKAVERQRMVYAALAEELRTDIHALSMETRAPGE